LLAIKRAGKLNEQCIALGIGCGAENPPFYLSNFMKYVFCTDLYTISSWNEANPQMLSNPGKIAPCAWNPRRMGVQVMDGTDIKFEDNSFDVVFSYSSIEHFGSREAIKKTMNEIERVLKPGGILSLATEILISGDINQLRINGPPIVHEIFTQEEVQKYLIDSNRLKLTANIDYSQHNEPEIKFPEEADKVPHIVLRYKGIKFGSLHLAMTKP